MVRKLLLVLAAGMTISFVPVIVTPPEDVGFCGKTMLLVVLIAGPLTGMVGGYIFGRERGRPVVGVLLGAWLCWLGWVVLAFIPAREASAEPAS